MAAIWRNFTFGPIVPAKQIATINGIRTVLATLFRILSAASFKEV
jgi:hypothetical protein